MKAIFVGTLNGVLKVILIQREWKIEAKALDGAEVNCLALRPDREKSCTRGSAAADSIAATIQGRIGNG